MQATTALQTVPTINIDSVFPYLTHALTDGSLAMYKRDFKAYRAYADTVDLSPVDAATLASWRDNLIATTTMSPNTINRMLAAIKRVMREAAKQKWIDRDTDYDFRDVEGVNVKKLKNRMRHTKTIPITPDTMRELCNLPDVATLLGLRDKALLYTLATSGIRASELASLRVDRIYKQAKGYIIQVMGKTDSEYRSANLSPVAYALIQDWLSKRGVTSEYVFTGFTDFGKHP